jgi:hypothetical protein
MDLSKLVTFIERPRDGHLASSDLPCDDPELCEAAGDPCSADSQWNCAESRI